MEVHAPERPVESVRDILIHLAVVTVGILIALGLEQTVEWYHNRKLAAEARENILNEIRDNKKELDKQIALLPGFRSAAIEALDFITDIQQKGKSDIQRLHLNLYEAELHSTGWATAEAVGALALMPYQEVNKYATAYHLQDRYLGMQDHTEDAGINAYSVFSARNKLEKLSKTELEAERAKLMTMTSALTAQIQNARRLERAYCGVVTCEAESPLPNNQENK